ncbi:NAD(P)-dependent oxidoreductase [Rhodococcus sp. CH91]|uniref:NAD(P)-dependent oxidoreductase n=1 Tax=Rhodococcus sp. CH91 TaxID=2910256 RepID=UPI001F4B21EA|nr:NAD(P)-binding domain-containing protein [Rhodococcus sp. CH91]
MSTRSPVSVLGLGPMGQAMARTLLHAGHPVTVWNRTPRRAEGVVAAGARRAATPSEALAAGDPTILSLTDYRAMRDVLGGTTASLPGRTLVNLSSDTPDRTRDAAAWAAVHGAAFLAGGVMVPAPLVGTEAAYVYYSGPEDVMERHSGTLAAIGTPRYLGEDPGLAQLMYLANLDVFLTALSSLAHAVALLQSAGLNASDALPELMPTLAGIPAMLATGESPAAQIDAGEHPGDLSTVTMMGATADHIVEASEKAGVDLALPRAVQRHYLRAIGDGHGGDNWTRIIDGIRTPYEGA